MAGQAEQLSEKILLAGRYRVDGSLGRGGMSEVFHGYDERLDRRVAIKLLHPSPSLPGAPDSPESAELLDTLERNRKRFLREVRMTAQLEHPGCVRHRSRVRSRRRYSAVAGYATAAWLHAGSST